MPQGAPPHAFFLPRESREVLGFVLDDFPFPLALTYFRLQEEMDRQEPIAAAWQPRDAYECLIRFCASIALADYFHTKPPRPEAAEVAKLLLRPRGLSIGDWHTLLEIALKPLYDFFHGQNVAGNGRLLPDLFPIFFKYTAKLKATNINRAIDSDDDDSFVTWRNHVFGHGVFEQDRHYYAKKTLRRIPNPHQALLARRPVFAEWTLRRSGCSSTS